MAFLAVVAGVIFVLSWFSWWVGVILFWALAVVVTLAVGAYTLTTLAFSVYWAKHLLTGSKDNWREFREGAELIPCAVFRTAESAIALFLMWWLWRHFYRP